MSIKKVGILTAGGEWPGPHAGGRAVRKNALRPGVKVLGF